MKYLVSAALWIAGMLAVTTTASAAVVCCWRTQSRLIAAVANDAMTDTAPLRNIIASFVDDAMIQRIAEEYGKVGAIAVSDFTGKRA